MTQMLDLFKYTFDGAPQAPNGDEGVLYTNLLLEVLYGDDNDNDLTNGTPNDDKMCKCLRTTWDYTIIQC